MYGVDDDEHHWHEKQQVAVAALDSGEVDRVDDGINCETWREKKKKKSLSVGEGKEDNKT